MPQRIHYNQSLLYRENNVLYGYWDKLNYSYCIWFFTQNGNKQRQNIVELNLLIFFHKMQSESLTNKIDR